MCTCRAAIGTIRFIECHQQRRSILQQPQHDRVEFLDLREVPSRLPEFLRAVWCLPHSGIPPIADRPVREDARVAINGTRPALSATAIAAGRSSVDERGAESDCRRRAGTSSFAG